ncbi:hypothetical protein STIAU_4439, partial [Stigmatella aurantiaca DW4/3-1]
MNRKRSSWASGS